MRLYETIVNTPNLRLPDGLTAEQLDSCKREINGCEIAPEVDLSGAYLPEAKLTGANLRWSKLCFTYLDGADLRDADLRAADLGVASIDGADLRGADLRGTNLAVYSFQNAKFRRARYNDETKFRKDFHPTEFGMIKI